ncbi:ArsR/SmtB family transcription factor [Microbacterium sp. bgisy203]|uniref:ArsR/SmtB family transcription factor n=1 Tax=Microbacterium sp. bgisy203 TaxID=3413799 RepID=UPI003D7577DC
MTAETEAQVDAIDAFKALSNPIRLQILTWLRDPRGNFPVEQGIADPDEYGVCITQIRDRTGLAQSTVSSYMATLERAGLVTSTRVGKWTHYRRNEDRLAELGALFTSVI